MYSSNKKKRLTLSEPYWAKLSSVNWDWAELYSSVGLSLPVLNCPPSVEFNLIQVWHVRLSKVSPVWVQGLLIQEKMTVCIFV